VTFVASDEEPFRFLAKNLTKVDEDTWNIEFKNKNRSKTKEETLLNTLQYGIGYIHDGLSESEIHYIKTLYTVFYYSFNIYIGRNHQSVDSSRESVLGDWRH
jgi:hypothetical protein